MEFLYWLKWNQAVLSHDHIYFVSDVLSTTISLSRNRSNYRVGALDSNQSI